MLDLTKLSYDEIVNQLIVILKNKTSWTSVPVTGTARTLIDLYAYVLQLLFYYLKRTAEENFVDTAQFWTSLVRIANMFNLYVVRPVGARGKVTLRIKSDASFDTYQISEYDTIVIGDVKCYAIEDVILNKTEWKDVLVKQGDRKTLNFSITSNDWQEFEIQDENAADEDMVVKSGTINYEVLTDLFEGVTDYRARIYTLPNKNMAIQFLKAYGLPVIGNTVNVTYSSVDYSWLPSVDDEIFVVDGIESTMDLDDWTPGSGFEDIEVLRQRLVDMYRIGKRLVTKFDFEKVFLSIPDVEKVLVLDVKDEFKAPFRGVKIYVKLNGRWDLTDEFLDRVNDEVIGRIGLQGVKVDIKPVSKVDVDIYVIVDKKVGYSNADIQTEITNELQKVYQEAAIGEWINATDIRRYILSLGYRSVAVVLPETDLDLKEGQLVNLNTVRVDIVTT